MGETDNEESLASTRGKRGPDRWQLAAKHGRR